GQLVVDTASDLRVALIGSQGREVGEREPEGRGRVDALDGPAVELVEGGAERLVAAHDLAEASLESVRVERAAQAHRAGDVVGGALRLEAVEEPEALLGEGERELGSIARQGHDGRLGLLAVVLAA